MDLYKVSFAFTLSCIDIGLHSGVYIESFLLNIYHDMIVDYEILLKLRLSRSHDYKKHRTDTLLLLQSSR